MFLIRLFAFDRTLKFLSFR